MNRNKRKQRRNSIAVFLRKGGSIADAQRKYNVSYATVYRAADQGKVTLVRIGKTVGRP